MKKRRSFIILFLCFFVSTSFAGEADVVDVHVSKDGETTYNFDVTVAHSDTGWKHYANKWDIIDDKGEIFGTRILYHPHVEEQPFTRSLSAVEIPQHIKSVKIRAHDSVHEYGGRVINVVLP